MIVTHNCVKCGKPIDKIVMFYPSCGTMVTGGSPDIAVQQADPVDAEQNKTMAVVANILFFVPLLTRNHLL